MSNKYFVPVRIGLITAEHRQKMGDAIWLYLRYLGFMGAHRDKIDFSAREICILVWPEAVQKELALDKETWRSWHAHLDNSGYISSRQTVDNHGNELHEVCIKKAFLEIFSRGNNINK